MISKFYPLRAKRILIHLLAYIRHKNESDWNEVLHNWSVEGFFL